MKDKIQNIFFDIKSYELIQNTMTMNELITYILNHADALGMTPLSINGYLFEVKHYPSTPDLSFIYTVQGYHTVDPYKNKFRASIYIYNCEAVASYADDFCGHEYLIYTTKPTLYVIPYKKNGLSIIDSSTGELIQML